MQVFADDETSKNPIHVPREWIWDLPRRITYFGTSTTTIFRGKLSHDKVFIVVLVENDLIHLIYRLSTGGHPVLLPERYEITWFILYERSFFILSLSSRFYLFSSKSNPHIHLHFHTRISFSSPQYPLPTFH